MSTVKSLLDVSVDEQRAFIDSFDYVLTDCDGTVWSIWHPFPGADEGIRKLEENGKKMIYVSNNSVRPAADYLKKFQASGITVNTDDIMHPATSTVHYLKMINFTGLAYVIGSSHFKHLMREAGFNFIEGSYDQIEDTFHALIKATYDEQPVEAVILDTDLNLTVLQLWRAEIYLKNPNCLFIVGTTDVVLPILPIKSSPSIFGPGQIYHFMESVTNRKPVIVGKPGLQLRDVVIHKYGIKDEKRVLFVGDTLAVDIGFGNVCGFKTLLVLCGATNESMLLAHNKIEELPNYYLNSYADFVTIFNNLK